MSGRPRGPSGSTSGRGEDDGITILPIIGGLVLGAGLLAFAYYHLSQKPECKKKIEKAKRIICPKILPSRRKWPIEEDECEAEMKQRRKEEEELNRLELERAEAELEEARLNQNAQPRCTCVNNPDVKKYLPLIAGVTVGLGVLSLLSIGCKSSPPSTITALPMSSRPIPYGEEYSTPTAVTIEDSEIEDCEECLKIDPRKRRWPTLEEEQEEYKRIRERDEQKRKVELLVQECIDKYQKSLDCDKAEYDENASGPL